MNITEIIEAIVAVFVVIMSLVVIPFIKSRIGEQNMDNFLKWVEIAVAAAEQLYDSADGPVKKRYVLNYLYSKGFTVDETEMNLAIEAAVNRLHNELYGAVSAE